MNRASFAERFVFFALALIAVGIMWNVFRPDDRAELATIVFPAETVCYAVDYGRTPGIHARDMAFDGKIHSLAFPAGNWQKDSLTVGELSGISLF